MICRDCGERTAHDWRHLPRQVTGASGVEFALKMGSIPTSLRGVGQAIVVSYQVRVELGCRCLAC